MIALALLPGCSNYDLKENLSYDQGSVPFGVFDVYTPTGCFLEPTPKGPFPVIFALHGGAWLGGNKSDMEKIAKEFCPSGYAVVAPNYRLSSDGPWGKGSPWPAQIQDCEKALRFVRANAKIWSLNPDRVASIGVSAGGHLATMICLRDDPQGPIGRTTIAVDVSGEMDMTKPGDQVMASFDDIMTKVLGHPKPWADAELKDISPVFFARPDAALLVIHSDGDDNVYFANAGWITDAMKAAKGDVSFIHVAGNHHGDAWSQPEALGKLHDFLDTHLKK